MHSAPKPHNWGNPPWRIDFIPSARGGLPDVLDFAVIGGGFTGLAAAAWLRKIVPEKSVAVLEAWKVGDGASGRTGGMALSESAAGHLPGLGDVLAGFREILGEFGVDCNQRFTGAWEIARKKGLAKSPIFWNDSGTLHVAKEVEGGTVDPGKLISGLARAADRLGALILENHPVTDIAWSDIPEIAVTPRASASRKISARKIIFATNALSLKLSELEQGTHPKLTLAVTTEPVNEEQLAQIGLAERKPFYTLDLPYLWGRVCENNSIIFGAGLVQAPHSDDLNDVDISAAEVPQIFDSLEKRIRGLHPALKLVQFTHRWGGPILFRDSWEPIFMWHPEAKKTRNAIVIGAFAGHGVALSSYLGCWGAEALLGHRKLPSWGKLDS
jgi:glycine/D-amino acid oxidase-like deaminating enzyme